MDRIKRLRDVAVAEKDAVKLRAIATELVASGVDRTQILDDLIKIRAELGVTGNAEIEDIVLDTMDYLVGWCAPHMKI